MWCRSATNVCWEPWRFKCQFDELHNKWLLGAVLLKASIWCPGIAIWYRKKLRRSFYQKKTHRRAKLTECLGTSSNEIHSFINFSLVKCNFSTNNFFLTYLGGGPRGVMVKAMNCGIVVREFVLQSCYYVHFRAKYPWEMYEPPYHPSYGLTSTTTVLLEE